MHSPEDFIEAVLAHEYDPQKAHEYYLRTRELRGRTPGQTTQIPVRRSIGTAAPRTARSALAKNLAEQHRKEIEAKVEALKTRLETLRKVLAELVRLAQARSGKDTTDSNASTSSDSNLTSTQKKAAAEASQKYYEEHKNDPLSPSEQLKDLQTKVQAVEAKIREMREKLNKTNRTAVRSPDSVGVRIKKR